MIRPQLALTDPLPLHPSIKHPVTGLALQAIGRLRNGRLVWPVMGGSQPVGQPPAQQPNTPGIPTLGGGFVPPNQPQGGPLPQTGQPGQQPGQPGGQPAAQPGQFPPGQPPFQPGQPGGQPQGHPGGQPPVQPPAGQPPVPGPPPGYTPPGDRGFPEGVPVERMNDGEAKAFYRYHMRKNQDELRRFADYDQVVAERDQLRQATQTELQRASSEAEQRGKQAGWQEAGGQVVEAWFRAAAAGRMSEPAVEAQLQVLDRTRFINNGQVNQQAIYDHVNVIVGGQMQAAQPGPFATGGGPIPPGQYGPAPQQHWQGYPGQYQPQQQGYPGQFTYGTPNQGGGQVPAGYGQQPQAGQPAYGQPAYGQQPVQQAPGGWPQYAPVPQQQAPQQPAGWNAPGMPGYGQPQYRQVPDYGQGQQPNTAQSSAEAGKQRAQQRHGTTRTAQREAQAAQNGRPGTR